MHKQEGHPDSPIWGAMDGTIPFHPICMCGVRHVVPTLQVERTDQGGRGGWGLYCSLS